MDIRIHAVTMKEALAFAEERIMEGKPSMIATANAEMIMIAQEDRDLARILNGADLVVPDGAGVLWAGEQLGTPFPERVTGADLTVELLKRASAMNWPVYFLGGNPGVAAKAAKKFMEEHGSFSLVGCHDGYFNEEEEKKIIEDIKKSGAKLLFAGLGVPKQEKWLYAHREELGLLSMGIGGVFDVMSGNLKRAPLWMQRNRLEWAYRLYLQPSRIGRMMALPRFMRAVKNGKKNAGVSDAEKTCYTAGGLPFHSGNLPYRSGALLYEMVLPGGDTLCTVSVFYLFLPLPAQK